MPVRPSLKPFYPADWPDISKRVRFVRAQGRCEQCGRPHAHLVYCLPDGRWYDAAIGAWIGGDACQVRAPSASELRTLRIVRVILTAAHIDHDPAHTGLNDSNIAALCSRCHILHDAPHHRAQRRITLRSRWALADLFDGPYGLVGYPRNAA